MKIKEITQIALNRLEQDKAEAEWLVALSFKISRNEVYSSKEVLPLQVKHFFKALKKREKGVPLQYIFKNENFYGYDFFVNKNVLIPRPETEELVLEALKFINRNTKVLDIGTGSGVIAISIEKQSGAKVTAIEVSRKALSVARKNAKKNKSNVEFLHSNLFSKLNKRKFNVIVSNPPYITESAYREIDKIVKKNEPKLALVGGEDGLKFYKKIIENAHKYLENGGKVFFEIGYDQAESVQNLFKENGFTDIVLKKDLSGNDRIVYATYKGERRLNYV